VPSKTLTRHDALIRKTYAAVGEQALWPNLLVDWAEAMEADSAMLFTPGNQFNSQPAIGHRIDFERATAYGEYYHLHDVWRFDGQQRRAFLPGTAVLGQTAVPRGSLHRTEFYNDFLRQMDHEWLMGSVLLSDQNTLGLPETVLSLYRRPGRRAFGRGAVHAFQEALPHLQRSLTLHHEILRMRAEKTLLESGLDHLAVGVVVFARSGQVQFANHRAQALLRAPPLSKGFESDLLGALQKLDRQALLGHYTGLPLHTGHGPLYAVATPHNRLTASEKVPTGHGSVIWLIDQQSTRGGPLNVAARMFGLSPAEQKVLGLLMHDLAPRQVAQQLSVELSTVRSQLSSLLQKTGVRRQQELLRLMAAFPQDQAQTPCAKLRANAEADSGKRSAIRHVKDVRNGRKP
jgi:DNA-binding CsgD family transcriptional regulator/PAS domain-containing protein